MFKWIVAVVGLIIIIAVSWFTGYMILSMITNKNPKSENKLVGLPFQIACLAIGFVLWYFIFRFLNAFDAFNHSFGLGGFDD